MCFSAEASFSTGAFILSLGILTKIKSYPKIILLGFIPLFFGIQQIIEGMNWLILEQKINFDSQVTLKLYLWFEVAFWPFFMPLACKSFCKNKLLNILNSIFLFIGTLHILYWSYIIYFKSISVVINCESGCGLNYLLENDINAPQWLYVSLVSLPFFFTQRKLLIFYSLVMTSSFFLSKVWFSYAWGSTWCFFAAALSFIIYLFIKSEVLEYHE